MIGVVIWQWSDPCWSMQNRNTFWLVLNLNKSCLVFLKKDLGHVGRVCAGHCCKQRNVSGLNPEKQFQCIHLTRCSFILTLSAFRRPQCMMFVVTATVCFVYFYNSRVKGVKKKKVVNVNFFLAIRSYISEFWLFAGMWDKPTVVRKQKGQNCDM